MVVHSCLTLIFKELKIIVEHNRVVTTLNVIKLNIIFSVARRGREKRKGILEYYIYIYFEFCEGKNHRHLRNIFIYKGKQSMLTKLISRKLYIF